MRAALLLAVTLPLLGCIAPITPMERLQQSANEVASALRFGRDDIAAEYVAASARADFMSRHIFWSKKTRVVDLELLGIFLRTPDTAEAILSVSWLHQDGAMLHTTEIAQQWKHEGGSYRMVNEAFRSGDKGLFDMLPKKEDPKNTDKNGSPKTAPSTEAQAASGDAPASPPSNAPVAPRARIATHVIREQ